MIKQQIYFLSIFLLIISCTPSSDIQKEYSTSIVAGTSKISGKINLPHGVIKDSITVTIYVSHPITGENVEYEILLDQSRIFSQEIDIETETSLVGLKTNLDPYKVFRIKAINNDSVHIEITYDSGNALKNVEIIPAMNKYDMMQSVEIFNKMASYIPTDPNLEYPHLYNKSIDEFQSIVKKNFTRRLELFVDNDNLLSEEFKDFIAKDYQLFLYTRHVFAYEAQMKINYRNATRDKVNIPDIQKIDRSHFRFLKNFDLSDSQYLMIYSFSEFQDSILKNEILAIPTIGERDIPSWLNEVKGILSNLVGFDEGQYYDILVANAYSRQLKEESRPLSAKQKENIANYWKDEEIVKILFRKNENVIAYEKLKSPTVVNDISLVPKEEVMHNILSAYKNKVVFIDLWATWCGPCLHAMKQFNTVKGDFQGKDIAFVYITNRSSPKKLWEEKIKGIGHNHYYLTDEQWEYIMNQFDFDYIPSYLLYSKEGRMVKKFSSFPGNHGVKAEISKLFN